MLGINFEGAKFKKYHKDNNNKVCNALPWSFFCGENDDGIILLKSGALMRCYTFTCPDLGTSSAESINRISLYFNDALRRLGSTWAFQIESRRSITSDYPGTSYDNSLAYLVDMRRKENYQNGEHFKNTFYLTISYALKNDIQAKATSLLYKSDDEPEGYYNLEECYKEIAYFRDKSDEILSYISSRIYVRALNNDETVSYLHSCISTHDEKRLAPKQPMFFDHFICDEDMDLSMCLKIGECYCPVISIHDFPSGTYPAMFDILNSACVEYRWVTRWIGLEKSDGQKVLEKYQKKFYGARKSWKTLMYESAMNSESGQEDVTAASFEADVHAAQLELSRDEISIGYYTSVLEVWHPDYDTAINAAKYLQGIINGCGFSAKVETVNSFQAWLSSLPGQVYANIRKYPLSSGNCSHILPLSSIWEGYRNNKWTAEHIGCSAPLLTCSTPSGTPFFLNMNINDVFHSFVFGVTGAGKSTFLCLLESAWLKYHNSHVIVLDKDKTARGVTMGAGGVYVEPGSDDIAFQPLRNLDNEVDLMWACEFIQQCLAEQNVHCTSDMTEAIREALIQLRDTKEPEGRDITSFQQYVTDPVVVSAIQPYTLTGQYGRIFDAKDTKIDMSRFVMIELGTLMKLGKACVTPALMYLFKFIESHFAQPNDENGHMTLLVMDEAWAYLDNDYFARTINDWLKTLRKKRVAVIFATQNVSDVAKSKIADTIISQCLTKFYLADPTATNDAIANAYRKFGLEDNEIEGLASGRMKRDYFYKSPNGARMFQLELDKYQLNVLCPDSNILDALENKYGRNCQRELAKEILDMQGWKKDTDRYYSYIS